MNNKLDIDEQKLNELIVVENVSVIKENLQYISEEVDKEIKFALSLNATEENKNEVKQARARLNNIKTVLESKRKYVKETVLKPYQQFEEIYNDMIKNKFEKADIELKTKIDDIEKKQIDEKRNELVDFFEEYRSFYHLESVIDSIDLVPIKINLSASTKSLKEQIQAFLIKISQDMQIMIQDPYREELLLEYKNNGYDYTRAKLVINQKHEEMEKLKNATELAEQQFKEDSNAVQEINTLVSNPIEVEDAEEEEKIEIIFKVKTTKKKLIELRNYLKSQEIEYE